MTRERKVLRLRVSKYLRQWTSEAEIESVEKVEPLVVDVSKAHGREKKFVFPRYRMRVNISKNGSSTDLRRK